MTPQFENTRSMDPDDEGADLHCELYEVFGCFEHANTFPPYHRLYLTSTLFEVCWGAGVLLHRQSMLHFGWTTQRTRFQVTAKVTQAEHLAADKLVSAVVMHVKLNIR